MTSKPLRFTTFLAPSVKPLYQRIADEVGSRLQLPTELVVGHQYAQAVDGSMDFGFICGLPYVALNASHPGAMQAVAAPVLRGDRYQRRPIYFSDVIVHRDSPLRGFAELRGRSWAYNEPLSHSGYGIVRHKLLELGETNGFFGRVIEAGFHQRSIRLVAAGEVDASAIDSQVLELELHRHPELAEQLRVIDVLGPSTIQPIVAAGSLSDDLRAAVLEVLTEFGSEADSRMVMDQAMVERIVPVSDSDYDDIRGMLQAAQAAGFTEVR